jgi:NAD(P)-dependent dehydrogenase (short-subunit alcohol dehydrogenase family)
MKEKTLNKKDIQKSIKTDDSFMVDLTKPLLENKVAIITGCSSGLGAATVKTFLKNGAKVVGCYYSKADERVYTKKAIEDVLEFISKKEYNNQFISLNLDIRNKETSKSLVKKTMSEFKKIDILCNFAGMAYFRNFENITFNEYKKIFDVNVNGHFILTQEVVKEMKKNSLYSANSSRGSIINMSSMTGLHVGENGVTDYAMTKGALHSFTLSLATELGKYGIRVNSIAPGSILTPINFRDYKNSKRRKMIEKRTSLNRWGFPTDVANVAIFLASDLSSYVTGENILVDGGMTNKFQLE